MRTGAPGRWFGARLSLASSFLDLSIQFTKLGTFTTPAFKTYFGDWNVWVRGFGELGGLDSLGGGWSDPQK